MIVRSGWIDVLFFFALLGIYLPASAQPTTIAPVLSDERDYAEYWEQQFYFETGALLTSQFLITNLPISKHHGLMIASLKLPGEPAVIIKNGRGRDGWTFSGDAPNLAIFQHELEGAHPGYKLRLHNTAAEVDVLFNAKHDLIELLPKDNELNLPEITLYAPIVRSFARWRAGPEIGGQGPGGEWQPLGHGKGYGLHVIQRVPLARTLRRWVRATPIESEGEFAPLIHHFETPSGATQTEVILIPRFGASEKLGNVAVRLNGAGELVFDGRKASGTITTDIELETFLIKDQLSGVEKLVAGSLADISRFRRLAKYKMIVEVDNVTHLISGTALLEEILIGKERRNRRRIRR